MTVNVSQPDVTLFLDMEGVIREVTVSATMSDESVDSWLGRPWDETVDDLGVDKVRRMIEDARARGISAFRQVTQRFPSGLELPMEYTTVLLGGKAGLLAIGKNLQAVAELQSRLIAAQQTLERDYWKLRETETRFRVLFDTANDAVVLVKASNKLRIVEANPAALAALGLSARGQEQAVGREFLQNVASQDHEALQAMLLRVREQGKAPAIRVRLGPESTTWLLKSSLMSADPGPVFMMQLTPVSSQRLVAPPRENLLPLDELLDRVPDSFIVLDPEGVIRRCNQAFLDLVQIASKNIVIGERLARWIWRPGADLGVLLANIQRHRSVRLFSTTIHGELGTDSEVEISAAGNVDETPAFIGMVLRDVTRRLAPSDGGDRLRAALGPLTEQVGKNPLRTLVKKTVGLVEQHYVKAALNLTSGNRTAAAEVLGLSRQSLHAKLNRYSLKGGSKLTEPSD